MTFSFRLYKFLLEGTSFTLVCAHSVIAIALFIQYNEIWNGDKCYGVKSTDIAFEDVKYTIHVTDM